MRVLRAIDLAVPLLGALASAALFLFGLGQMAMGAVSGTVIASASWAGLHILGRRLVRASRHTRALLAVLMATKLVAIAALVFVAVTVLGLDGVGMAVGLSSLPLGILTMAAVFGTGEGEDGERGPRAEVESDA